MNTKATRNTIAAALSFLVLSGGSAVAAEQEDKSLEAVTVSYADLDLTRLEGRETLLVRLRGAAQNVCGEPRSKVAREIRENRECRQFAVDRALRQVGSVQVVAIQKF
jgi:UrcA family protein